MPTTYTVTCWDCETPFDHKNPHHDPAKAWEEALKAKWCLIESINAENPRFRCRECQAKFEHPLGRRKVFHPITVIAVTFAVMRQTGGWISREEAQKLGKPSTGEMVSRILAGLAPMPEVLPRDVDEANAAVAWLMYRHWHYPTNQHTPIYERRLSAEVHARLNDEGVYLDGYTPKRYSAAYSIIGKIASAAIVYRDGLRKERRKTTWESLKGSKELPVGTRIQDVKVTVTHSEPQVLPDGRTVYRYKLLDDDGTAYKVFRHGTPLAAGSRVIIKKAKVIRYDHYQGVTFNVLAGVTVREMEAA